jgi:hypothetical protein
MWREEKEVKNLEACSWAILLLNGNTFSMGRKPEQHSLKKITANVEPQHLGERAEMERDRLIDRSIANDVKKLLGAYTPGVEEQLIALLDRIKDEDEHERKALEAEAKWREAIDIQFKKLFHLLTYEQYNVLYLANVHKLSREEIWEKTGKSPGALRKLIHDTKQTIKERGLWEKFANLFDF